MVFSEETTYNAKPQVVNFTDIGGIPNDNSHTTELRNGELLNRTLQNLQPGNTLLIEGTFHLMGGILASYLEDVIIQLDGTLVFSSNIKHWPRRDPEPAENLHRTAMECLHFIEPHNLTLTSSLGASSGILDGQGSAWWGIPLIGYLIRVEDRPRLLRVTNGTDVLLENWLLLDSPYWTTWFKHVDGLEIRYSGISSRRTKSEGHGLLDLSAFNTDGFDVSGRNIWIHDCNVWCQDDIVAVKDDTVTNITENVLVERINGTGLGLTIGSIGGNVSYVRNITFRDSYLYRPVKGIYLKFRRGNDTRVEDVVMENIVMDEPEQWAVWMGPAQQTDSRSLCYANPCSICWPFLPGAECKGEPKSMYRNITLRNVTINKPKQGGGVVLADNAFPMIDITFDSVRVDPCGKSYVQNVHDAFPMLPKGPLRSDNFVTLFNVVIIVGIVCLGIFLAVVTFTRCSLDRARTWCGKSFTKIAYGVISLEIILVPFLAWLVHLTLTMAKPNAYYVCVGVINGIARGDTWPVPSCFKDLTTSSDEGHSRDHCSYVHTDPAVGVALTTVTFVGLGLFSLLIAYFLKRQGNNNPRFAAIPLDDGEEEDYGQNQVESTTNKDALTEQNKVLLQSSDIGAAEDSPSTLDSLDHSGDG